MESPMPGTGTTRLAKARMAAELNIIYELMLFLVLVPGTLEAAILLAVMVRELNDL